MAPWDKISADKPAGLRIVRAPLEIVLADETGISIPTNENIERN
jgi:hypothetical protein